VRVHGGKGNPTAIGARIEILVADKLHAVREIAAGAGYLAQTSPVAWFAGVPAIAKARVRWPDGSVTEHALAAKNGRVELSR